MQTLGIDEEPTKKSVDLSAPYTGFWKRQFQQEATDGQKIFDWVFGVWLPVACFFFDPIVFKTHSFGSALLGSYKPFAYLFTFVAIMAMVGWLLDIKRLPRFSAAFGSLFAVGGLISGVIGVIIFPFSVIGLLMLIGVLGFIPLFTSFVYLRNSMRAINVARALLETRSFLYSSILTALFAFVVPYVANVEINRRVDAMLQGDERTIYKNAAELKWVAPLVNLDRFKVTYYRADSQEPLKPKEKAMADVFNQLTGEDLERMADTVWSRY